MSYSAARIANYFIEKSDYTITPMKVLKLVYIAHGWCLAITDSPLIDEPVEAWRYGPVIRNLYDGFKRYGNQPITELAQYLYEEENISQECSKLLDKIWGIYGDYTGVQLSNLTHKKGTPWDKIWKQHEARADFYKIDDELIKNYYKKLKHIPQKRQGPPPPPRDSDNSKQIVQIEKGYIDRLESSISQICKALNKIIDSHHASLGECFDEIKKLEHDLQEYKDKHARDMAWAEGEITKREVDAISIKQIGKVIKNKIKPRWRSGRGSNP